MRKTKISTMKMPLKIDCARDEIKTYQAHRNTHNILYTRYCSKYTHSFNPKNGGNRLNMVVYTLPVSKLTTKHEGLS